MMQIGSICNRRMLMFKLSETAVGIKGNQWVLSLCAPKGATST